MLRSGMLVCLSSSLLPRGSYMLRHGHILYKSGNASHRFRTFSAVLVLGNVIPAGVATFADLYADNLDNGPPPIRRPRRRCGHGKREVLIVFTDTFPCWRSLATAGHSVPRRPHGKQNLRQPVSWRRSAAAPALSPRIGGLGVISPDPAGADS